MAMPYARVPFLAIHFLIQVCNSCVDLMLKSHFVGFKPNTEFKFIGINSHANKSYPVSDVSDLDDSFFFVSLFKSLG